MMERMVILAYVGFKLLCLEEAPAVKKSGPEFKSKLILIILTIGRSLFETKISKAEVAAGSSYKPRLVNNWQFNFCNIHEYYSPI